jgi:hypothetical protein
MMRLVRYYALMLAFGLFLGSWCAHGKPTDNIPPRDVIRTLLATRRSAAEFATPPLRFCAKSRHPTWHNKLRTGLQIPTGFATCLLVEYGEISADG